jgi:hypothetical protein
MPAAVTISCHRLVSASIYEAASAAVLLTSVAQSLHDILESRSQEAQREHVKKFELDSATDTDTPIGDGPSP